MYTVLSVKRSVSLIRLFRLPYFAFFKPLNKTVQSTGSEWENVKLYCKELWVVIKTRKALYKYKTINHYHYHVRQTVFVCVHVCVYVPICTKTVCLTLSQYEAETDWQYNTELFLGLSPTSCGLPYQREFQMMMRMMIKPQMSSHETGSYSEDYKPSNFQQFPNWAKIMYWNVEFNRY